MSTRPSSAALTGTAPLFAALGDPTRLRVVTQLCGRGPLSIAQLTEGSGVTRQAITKHLRALEEVGLVQGHRHGRERIWELALNRLSDARLTLETISTRWDQALARLKKVVED